MDYLQIMKRALAISWRHKYLWLVALFAGEATTLGMSFSGGSSDRNPYSNASGQEAWTQLTHWVGAHTALLWPIVLTVPLVRIALFVLPAVANGALVKGGAEHDAERRFGLREAWSAGVQSFWPVLRLKLFGLSVALSLAIVIGGLVLMTVVFALSGVVPAAVGTGLLAG